MSREEDSPGDADARSLAELWREAFQEGDMSMMRAEIRLIVLVW